MLRIDVGYFCFADGTAACALALEDRSRNFAIVAADNANRYAMRCERDFVLHLRFVRVVFQNHTIEDA